MRGQPGAIDLQLRQLGDGIEIRLRDSRADPVLIGDRWLVDDLKSY